MHVVTTTAVACAVVFGLGWLTPWWPALYPIEALRLHAAGVLGVASLLAARSDRRALLGVAPVVVSLLTSPATAPVVAASQTWTVLLWNARIDNRDLSVLDAVDADVLVLLEVDGWWREQLATLEDWPHVADLERPLAQGAQIRSRFPLSDVRVVDVSSLGHAVLSVEVQVDDAAVRLVAAHFPRLSNATHARAFADMTAAIAVEVDGPTLLAGDLNQTPWMSGYAAIVDETGLTATTGVGSAPTWPAWLPAFGLPLDHVLVRDVGVVSHRVGPSWGSDHRSVHLTLQR
jgi:endonuclease/exonuclease/phosphatase (EEP) superfamily protein YafD